MTENLDSAMASIEKKVDELSKARQESGPQVGTELAELEKELRSLKAEVYAKLTPWQRVQLARHQDRPLFEDYVSLICSEFIELHGDRYFGDDRALIGGFAIIDQYRVMLIGFNKGRSLDDKVKSNFGMAHPEGYRKALRLMKLAEKYNLPIVCLVDTPAAYPGAAAEERGQAEAIARSITEMTGIAVPIVAVVTGEGGSGGALGIAVADVVLMMSNAIYSVIPPEGCASILWKDASKASEAAEALKITAESLLELKVIDEIIEEPLGGAHRDHAAAAQALRKALAKHLRSLKKVSARRLLAKRFEKYAKIGEFKR